MEEVDDGEAGEKRAGGKSGAGAGAKLPRLVQKRESRKSNFLTWTS